ncbi:MAG: hypothetical protein ACOC58_02440 [Chloroflexota bacterium]
MDNLFLILGWSGPIGVGIFLVCLGAMIYLLTRASEVDQRTKERKQQMKK